MRDYDSDHHCPFLNRSDPRCSRNFSLERLDTTYDFCFGQYGACPTYGEMLLERRERRAQVAEAISAIQARAMRWSGEDRDGVLVPLGAVTHGGRRITAA